MTILRFLLLFLAWTPFRTDAWVLPMSSSSFIGCSKCVATRKRNNHASRLSMGLQIKIRIVGRKNPNESWLEDAYRMYETRLTTTLQVETVWHKTNLELIKGMQMDQSKGQVIVLLDPNGQTMTSERFSLNLYKWLDQGGSRIVFLIGGAEGLPEELKNGKKDNMLSLSAMTLTHQFARTFLMEQIYRATEIRKGSGYHK